MRKYTYDYLIVGSGLFGSTFAQIMNGNGKKCLVIDKRGHTGGNIYTKEENDIKIHWYGAHIFHTDNEEVWHYINKFTKFNNYINSPLAYSEGKLYNLPFNMNTFNKLWNVNTPEEAKHKIQEQCSKYKDISQPANLEEQALKLCGDDIYYTFIKEYTEKQWGRPANQLPASIIKRIPFRLTYNNNYFNDPYQGIPKDGYTALTNNLLKDIHVQTYTNYFDNIPYFQSIAEKILFTGCIDEYFEYKHFEFGKQPSTIITKEYPQKYTPSDEPYYPINDEKNLKCFNKYKALAEKNSHVIFGGRLGQYAYFDMDDTIASAISLTQKELSI